MKKKKISSQVTCHQVSRIGRRKKKGGFSGCAQPHRSSVAPGSLVRQQGAKVGGRGKEVRVGENFQAVSTFYIYPNPLIDLHGKTPD